MSNGRSRDWGPGEIQIAYGTKYSAGLHLAQDYLSRRSRVPPFLCYGRVAPAVESNHALMRS